MPEMGGCSEQSDKGRLSALRDLSLLFCKMERSRHLHHMPVHEDEVKQLGFPVLWLVFPVRKLKFKSGGVTLQPAAGNAASANNVGFEWGVRKLGCLCGEPRGLQNRDPSDGHG